MSDTEGTSDEAEALEVRRRWARLVRAVDPVAPVADLRRASLIGGGGRRRSGGAAG
ncbi:MAG: hypothetical protein M9894_20980 [Planctomycetes bacterium]|nr:hypothetical protein [Planctomycetota bacterium]